MKSLKVFDGLDIPVDYAAIQKYVTLGASDSGKTFMLARFAEQLAKAGGFFALLDPVGKHWALRAGPDGTPEGGIQDVWVIGGLHGDVPLDPASGALIADTVVDHPGRYVIDTSLFETDQDVYNFAAAFAKRLFRRKMRDAGWPLLLMLEESETFLPQQPQAGQQAMKGAFGRIVRQGRNHGLGVFLVFQRSAAGDKGAISQCKILIVKRASHKRDQDAVDDWVKSNGTPEQRDELMSAMASLEVEEAYVWDPIWLKVFKRVKVLPRETFDSTKNVAHGEKMAKVELVPLDVDALGEKMRQVAEKAIDEDPRRLQKRIAELEKELERDQGALEDVAAADEAVKEMEEQVAELRSQIAELEQRPAEPVIVEKPVIDDEAMLTLETIKDDLSIATSEFQELLARVTEMHGEKSDSALPAAKAPTGAQLGHRALTVPPALQTPAPAPKPRAITGDLTKAQLEIVEAAVALFPRPVSPVLLGIMLAKAHTAGPFRGAITAVTQAGYIDEDGRATQQARQLVGSVPLPTAEEVQQRWRSRPDMSGTKLKIFETALAAWPETVTPQGIGAAIDKNPNAGPIRGMMNDLAAWQLVTYDKDAGVRVSDYLISLTGDA